MVKHRSSRSRICDLVRYGSMMKGPIASRSAVARAHPEYQLEQGLKIQHPQIAYPLTHEQSLVLGAEAEADTFT